MSTAIVFPGQGSQFPGMGRSLYEKSSTARALFERANSLLGFRITDIMFEGQAEDLKATRVTQPAVFLHSVALYLSAARKPEASMMAGHSLGEISALTAAGVLDFDDGLLLAATRAQAMQKACDAVPSTMAAVLGLDDGKVEEACAAVQDEVVVAANYNCPGQLVISGSVRGVEKACEILKTMGAKRTLVLPVGGAFHSPLMEPARVELAQAIEKCSFRPARVPVYQNVTGLPESTPEAIKARLIEQLTAPVRWTQTIRNMWQAGARTFLECGPGNVLQGLVRKIVPEAVADAVPEEG
ncbi:MAG: ACP S-malonyltransferase [Flavobacteriales bacterium]|nr:ACP S-malonyltransferase [Flavobacteriales bacterium]MCX7649863.1 ACP S-malonyltransferase [Flavobacteriales bacterium]MDW8432911.1 ACP S-malonyltransferase [Flavobacteriales bacterium]